MSMHDGLPRERPQQPKSHRLARTFDVRATRVRVLNGRSVVRTQYGPGFRRRAIWLLAVLLVLVGCSDARQYEAALDALAFPPSWEIAKTVVAPSTDFCASCPRVSRYYLAEGEMPAVLKQAEESVHQAGYTDVQTSDPNCDRNSNGAVCSITARSDRVLLIVAVYRPGDDVDGLGLARDAISLIRITAQSR